MQQSREARLQKRREHAGQDATVKQANSGNSVVTKDEQQNANEHNGRKKPERIINKSARKKQLQQRVQRMKTTRDDREFARPRNNSGTRSHSVVNISFPTSQWNRACRLQAQNVAKSRSDSNICITVTSDLSYLSKQTRKILCELYQLMKTQPLPKRNYIL